MRLTPPIRRSCAVAVAAIASAAIAAGCGAVPPSADLLLIAMGGPLQVTDASGSPVSFDGPADPVVAVTASVGHVVAATAGGALTASDADGTSRMWRALAVPTSLGDGLPLMALSPLGRELALAIGDPQGERFDLVIIDVATGTSRTIGVERGLNGPPSWIGTSAVAIDVIGPEGNSEIATIDTGRGAITDALAAAGLISATADGLRVAVDDPSGDVLIGDLATWRTGSLGSMARVHGPAGSGVESLALSPDGGRLAVVRRDDAGAASIELFRDLGQGWSTLRTLTVPGDGPVSVAWLR